MTATAAGNTASVHGVHSLPTELLRHLSLFFPPIGAARLLSSPDTALWSAHCRGQVSVFVSCSSSRSDQIAADHMPHQIRPDSNLFLKSLNYTHRFVQSG